VSPTQRREVSGRLGLLLSLELHPSLLVACSSDRSVLSQRGSPTNISRVVLKTPSNGRGSTLACCNLAIIVFGFCFRDGMKK
jgi:hypothetical protein